MNNGLAMDGDDPLSHYRPIYKQLRVGSKEYLVLDKEQSAIRAKFHLNEAVQLLESAHDAGMQSVINRELTLATDFGCKDAPFLLALRILSGDAQGYYGDKDVIIFLRIAAERCNLQAAYRLAASYAAMKNFEEIEQIGQEYFAQLDLAERTRLARHYFQIAIDGGYQEAIEELIIAYAYGRGYIKKNAERFHKICQQLVGKNNQAVALGYGAWLVGMTVEAEKPLSEAITVEVDLPKALDCFLQASRGQQVELAQHALYLLCMTIDKGLWGKNDFDRIKKRLIKEAYTGNQLVALYLAWYSLPIAMRHIVPKFFENRPLIQLAQLFSVADEDVSAEYLDTALFGGNELLTEIAKELLTRIYGSYLFKDQDVLYEE